MSNRMRPRGRAPRNPLEFHRDVVAIVLDEGRPMVEVADATRVEESTLRGWVDKTRRRALDRGGAERR